MKTNFTLGHHFKNNFRLLWPIQNDLKNNIWKGLMTGEPPFHGKYLNCFPFSKYRQFFSKGNTLYIFHTTNAYTVTTRWLPDDYPMTIKIIILWGDFELGARLLTYGGILLTFGGVIINYIYPTTTWLLSDDYLMTIQWLSRAFDLFFLMIIDLKRCVDRR